METEDSLNKKVLWTGSVEILRLDEEMLVKNYGMSKEKAHEFMLELIKIVEEDEDEKNNG